MQKQTDTQNGKGDKWRKGTNFSKYRENYDKIFRKIKPRSKVKAPPTIVFMDKKKNESKYACRNSEPIND